MKKRYICKCGKIVYKSTTADNTGNRDTAGCEGCPYLLPWGPMIFGTNYDGTKGYHMEIHGYECRMSPSISYASTYYGSANDKCTLRIISLDLDFLEEIQAWMERYTKGQLYGGFSRNAIRSTDYSNEGRYSWSISCAQNKQGMAAKAELIQKFFRPDKSRRGKTPEEEKAIVLAAIEEGKAAHQRKKENMRYTISENLENDCVYAYAAKEFWVYDKQACRWYTSEFCREQYERAKQKLSRLTPEDFLTDSNDYSLLDDYELPCAALDALLGAVKGGKREAAPFEDTNPTDADADASPCAPGASDVPPLPSQSAAADAQQGGGDDTANPTSSAAATAAAGTTADSPGRSDSADMTEASAAESCGPADLAASTAADADLPEVCRGCQCVTCENKDCATPCWMDPKEVDECERLGVAGDDCEDYQPKEDTQCLKKPVPNGEAAASTDENAAQELQLEETPITPTNASSSSAPASLADAGAATQSLSAADAASLAADPVLVFDYSGLDVKTVDTLHVAEQMIFKARRDAHIQIAQAVSFAHEALCGGVVQNLDNSKHGNRGDESFSLWCKSVGISRSAAYNYLNVAKMFFNSTPEEQAVLLNVGKSLLNEASKPSTPVEAAAGVKSGSITTPKQLKELEAQLKAEREAREQAEQQLADARREHQAEHESASALLRDEKQRRQAAEEGRIAAQSKAARYAEMKDAALETLKNEREKLRAAQSGQAQQLADAKKQWQAAADREKQAAVAAAIEQAQTDARASAAVDVLFDQLENTVAALQAALETLEEMDIDKAAKLRRSLVRLLQTLAAQMGVG